MCSGGWLGGEQAHGGQLSRGCLCGLWFVELILQTCCRLPNTI